MLVNFCSPAFLFSHGAIQGSVRHHALGGASEGVGHSHVGWRAGLLWVFRGIHWGAAQGLWSFGLGNLGSTSLVGASAGQAVRVRLLYWVPHARRILWLEREALWDHFLHGLADHVKDEIYSLELPAGLDRLIDLAIRVDDHFALRSWHRKGGFPRECVTARSLWPLVIRVPNASSSRRRSPCRLEEHS